MDPNRAGLLRRIAESVFWIGRNLERADATARILDVHLQLVLEDPWVEEQTACRSLLSIMGIQAPDEVPVSTITVLDRLAYGSEPTAIRGSLMAARENARGAREILSSEFWSAINSTWLAMPEARRMAERLGPHVYFTWIREQTATLAGVVDLTISRDTAWRFLTLGRSLERADMTARLLLTRALPGAPGRGRPSWSALLRSCGAYEAFLRTYRGDLDEAAAVEFLLLDRLFPRSVFFALSAAEGCLNELTPGRARAGVPDLARRRLGRARTQLEFRSPEDLLGDLTTVLVDLERTCSEVSEAVSHTFFEASHAKAWAQGGSMIIQADRPRSRRFRIRHETIFAYDDEVAASYNEVRMTPASNDHQTATDNRIEVRPASTAFRYIDYWGTIVHAFDTSVVHRELRVVASSLVDTKPEFLDHSDAAGWDALHDRKTRDGLAEWLIQTGRTEPDEELRALAHDVVRGKTPSDAARAASEFVNDKIEYVPGVTGVHSRIGDVWSERKGVCQDIAHLTITLLRLAGIPARYVSGYLQPRIDAEIGETATGESHAWIEWWDGAWTGFDPTNAIPAGERHVIVGHGREYGDVAPFKGLYSGSAGSSLAVTVEVTRLF